MGDDRLEGLMAELDERQAVVFVHPTPMLKFMFETTRTVIHLLLQDGMSRYSQIHWIIPHSVNAFLSALNDTGFVFMTSTVYRGRGVRRIFQTGLRLMLILRWSTTKCCQPRVTLIRFLTLSIARCQTDKSQPSGPQFHHVYTKRE